MDTVKLCGTEGTLFKVVDVKEISGAVAYFVEPLQHWQVPRPCDESLLGWSSEYRDVACALAAGVGEADASLFKKECELRTHARKKLSADEIELDTENITFNDIKELVVLPLAHRSKKRCGGPSSLAYSRILGPVDTTHSSDGSIAPTAVRDGKGLPSRRANIFFSWSFTQRFEDFIHAFEEYNAANIPEHSQQRMYGWVSPLSLDQLATKKDKPADWATKFEVLIRAIGGNEKGEEGKGHGTVVVFTPVSPPFCSPALLAADGEGAAPRSFGEGAATELGESAALAIEGAGESFEPEPLTRMLATDGEGAAPRSFEEGAALAIEEAGESFEPEPLTRMWCVWEMFVTKKTGTRLTVIVPRNYVRPPDIYVKSRNAKCTGSTQAQLIRRVIEVQATMEVDVRLNFADVDNFVKDAFENGTAPLPPFSEPSAELPSQADSLTTPLLDVDGGYNIQSPLLSGHG
jgi:hypothetical protein